MFPLLIGSNRTEWSNFTLLLDLQYSQSDNIYSWNRQQIEAALDKKYGAQKEAVVGEFLKAYPNKTRADALYIDTMIRQPILKVARHKVAQVFDDQVRLADAPDYALLKLVDPGYQDSVATN